jgi:hypothetical protein
MVGVGAEGLGLILGERNFQVALRASVPSGTTRSIARLKPIAYPGFCNDVFGRVVHFDLFP